LDRLPDIKGVVTVDCDGQHTLEDTITCAKLTQANPNRLILGCRQFHDKKIPLRSRFGNKLTSLVILFLCGIRVSDSQTGLRGMSRILIREYFANTKGERFEYETNMLIKSKDCLIPILEFPIQTIYLENNESSHFHPLLDSIRIYKVFLKFVLSSFSSYVIDIVFFYLFVQMFRSPFPDSYIWTATILARLISSVYNFMINKNQVFQNNSKSPHVLVKYYILCVVQTVISAHGVKQLFLLLTLDESLLKSCLDVVLFLVGFQIQRRWVFRKEKDG
ncbi:MAG: GtrA family protein, partial [Lachnoclostridium sp.]|nr:GtrA family protein [Lachnoclostridium sp.]